jgi:hypothetical protein
VLAGRLRFRLGDEKRVVGAEDGEMVVAPGVTHGIESVSDREARLHTLVSLACDCRSSSRRARRRERKGCSRRAGIPDARLDPGDRPAVGPRKPPFVHRWHLVSLRHRSRILTVRARPRPRLTTP